MAVAISFILYKVYYILENKPLKKETKTLRISELFYFSVLYAINEICFAGKKIVLLFVCEQSFIFISNCKQLFRKLVVKASKFPQQQFVLPPEEKTQAIWIMHYVLTEVISQSWLSLRIWN